MKKKQIIKPTAFHKWLMKVTDGKVVALAQLLTHEIITNQNPQAFDLLEATGDKHYTPQTFIKAAKILIQLNHLHNEEDTNSIECA